MLKAMRKNIKSLAPTLWIVIAAFVVAIFAVWGGAGRLGEGGGGDMVAVVGKEKIPADVYFMNLRQRLETLQKEFRELNRTFIQQLNLPQQVLEQMIQQSLLFQLADRMGVSVSDDEIRAKIMGLAVFQKDGRFIGFEEYQKLLNWNRISVTEFESNLSQEIRLKKLIALLTAGITATESEIRENYKKENETARLEYLVLETDKVETAPPPTEEELRAYFEKNPEEFRIPERREGVVFFLESENLKKEVEISDSEIEKYYKENKTQFSVPEDIRVSRIYIPFEGKEKKLILAEMGNIRERVEKGEDFADLARKHSRDAKASDGGAWGPYEWMTLSAREQEEVRRLKQGELSPLLELEDGISLLRVTEKSEEKTTPLEEAKPRIHSILEDQKAQALASDRVSRLAKQARKEKSLESAAAKSNLEVRRIGPLRSGESFETIDPAGSLSQALFDLEEKDISPSVFTYKGVGVVQLIKIDPARPAQIEEVREELQEKVLGQKKKETALEKMRAVRSKLEEKKDWEAVAREEGIEYKTVNEHKRGQYLSVVEENEEVDILSFSLPLNAVSEPVAFDKGYVLLRVLERKEVTAEDFEKDSEEARLSLLDSKRNRFLQSYVSKLRDDIGVKVHYDVYLRVSEDVLSRFEQ